jgi:hypothetical protein
VEHSSEARKKFNIFFKDDVGLVKPCLWSRGWVIIDLCCQGHSRSNCCIRCWSAE